MSDKEEARKDEAFDTKYRPRSLDEIVGHDAAVARLRGMIKQNRVPNALMFLGPTSSGKTTLAYAFAADVNGTRNISKHPDFLELNASSERGIDEMRDMLRVARLAPRTGKRRFILIEEAQGLTPQAMGSILAPVEKPSPNVTFLFCSMDASKWGVQPYRALAIRCQIFNLEPHTRENICIQLKRIARAESLKIDDYKKVFRSIADASNGEMRTASKLLEALVQYSVGSGSKRIGTEALDTVFSSTADKDDRLAGKVVFATYARKYNTVHRLLLDVADPFGFINKMLWANSFMLNYTILNGERHAKLWFNPVNKELLAACNELEGKSASFKEAKLQVFGAVNEALVSMKADAHAFAVSEVPLISAKLFHAIQELNLLRKGQT
jgi:DNA polymerase III gamma/tau subunit